MKIKTLPDTCLLRKCEEVTEINDELRLAVKEMADLLLATNGYGLAAPQVGILKRFFIVMSPNWDQYKVFVNPEIISIKGKKVYGDEGCLSIPGRIVSVPRYEKIKISYFELDGTEYIEEYKGDLARVMQHERDHLDGKLITEYL
jgi:peptide deformylase